MDPCKAGYLKDVDVSIGYWAPLEYILLVCLFGDGGVGSDGRYWGASGFKPCPRHCGKLLVGFWPPSGAALQLCPRVGPERGSGWTARCWLDLQQYLSVRARATARIAIGRRYVDPGSALIMEGEIYATALHYSGPPLGSTHRVNTSDLRKSGGKASRAWNRNIHMYRVFQTTTSP